MPFLALDIHLLRDTLSFEISPAVKSDLLKFLMQSIFSGGKSTLHKLFQTFEIR